MKKQTLSINIYTRCVTLLLLLVMASAAPAENVMSPALVQFAGSRAIDPEKTSVYILDLEEDTVMAAYNADRQLTPASIMKTLTIASLLEKTDIDHRYETKVYTVGKIKDGVLNGHLLVEGSGDPSLNAKEPVSENIVTEIVNALRRDGIRDITGGVEVDEGVFSGPSIPATWAKGDLSQSYGTGSHGFNFESNSSGKSAISNPASVFATRLRSAARKAGISIGTSVEGGGKKRELLTHESAPIDEIMRSCMMRSDNLYAESMLRTLAALRGGDGSTETGAKLEREYWKKKKLPVEQIEIVDGSGLSRSNKVTAEFMGDMLAEMSGNVDYASFFPLAGQEGTLRSFLAGTPLDSYIALKTGSMNGIQCYAGYKLDEEYAPTHVVVVMLNALPKGRAASRTAVEKLLLETFKDTEKSDNQ